MNRPPNAENAGMKTRTIITTGAAVLAVGASMGVAQLGKIKKSAEQTRDAVERSVESVRHAAGRAADAPVYGVDKAHSTVLFKIKHAKTSNFYGRFDDIDGEWSFDPATPESGSFSFEITTSKINTGNRKRDSHLKSADFFNSKQFPKTSFQSTSISKGEGGLYQLEGDLTLLGETRPISAELEFLGTGNFNGPIAAFEARFTISRSAFGMTGFEGGLGDDVSVIVAVEGPRE